MHANWTIYIVKLYTYIGNWVAYMGDYAWCGHNDNSRKLDLPENVGMHGGKVQMSIELLLSITNFTDLTSVSLLTMTFKALGNHVIDKWPLIICYKTGPQTKFIKVNGDNIDKVKSYEIREKKKLVENLISWFSFVKKKK